jgi:hypothetical protein
LFSGIFWDTTSLPSSIFVEHLGFEFQKLNPVFESGEVSSSSGHADTNVLGSSFVVVPYLEAISG